MFPKLPLLSIFISRSLVSALGCYPEGPKFTDLKSAYGTVDGDIKHFCNYLILSSPYSPRDRTGHCYQFDNNKRLDIAVTNTGTSLAEIGPDDCYADFETERGNCVHGSEQQYGNFTVLIDPNDGTCPT